ncbi:hypothetical protein [Nocardia goodfellowii]|uniref:NUDIX hydrolase n=1 Tax=Nocardia goodfellowii TaxID=882446 RepID=A0ABS4QPN6_9NOCA|nr:hypothetical protein [Nocardia goodfellowii]MBP2192984.1 hypothetical protein [Nocardia goodfellowii]
MPQLPWYDVDEVIPRALARPDQATLTGYVVQRIRRLSAAGRAEEG